MWLLMLYICDHLLVFYIACSCFNPASTHFNNKKEEHEHINNRKEEDEYINNRKEEDEYINNCKEGEAKNTWLN
jgi:hypothetical protein